MKPQTDFSQEDNLPPGLKEKNKLSSKKAIVSPLIFRNFSVEILSDIKQCFNLWQEMSFPKTLFDTWEFRYAFYLGYKHEPYFILIKNGDEKVGLLPLWHEKDKKKYFWFGSWWQEENRFFVKDPFLIPNLLSLAPGPLHLNAISLSSVFKIRKLINFQKDEPKYILNLKNLKSSEDFLMKLKKNRRRNLRKDKNRILKQNPKIILNNFSNFDDLVRLSLERFKQKGEDVDWEDPRRIEAFRQVIKLGGKSYKVRMITVLIKDKIAGVDLIALFNNCYYTLKCGYDIKNFSGIGNFVNLFEINDAIALGMKKIDFLQNNYQWKQKFFTPIPLLKYEK